MEGKIIHRHPRTFDKFNFLENKLTVFSSLLKPKMSQHAYKMLNISNEHKVSGRWQWVYGVSMCCTICANLHPNRERSQAEYRNERVHTILCHHTMLLSDVKKQTFFFSYFSFECSHLSK